MQADWLALALAPGVTQHQLQDLLAAGADAAAIRNLTSPELQAAGLSAAAVRALQQPDARHFDTAMAWLEQPGHHLLGWTDPLYPELLRASGQGPLCLFVAGNPADLSLPQLAIVGSRNATADGLECAAEFAGLLARSGITITSGLARGIDAAAHAGALDAGGRTIAVEATGLDQVYPREHVTLAARIEAQGARVTELPPGVTVRRDQFPRRNRIIAGLCLGTLVVEAGRTSGALITARHSGDYGREVFAIPGSIHNPLSKGCHRLIRQGAKLVETAADIIEELGPLLGNIAAGGAGSQNAATAAEAIAEDPDYAVLLQLLGHAPATIDRLAARSGLTADTLSSMLLILELQGKVRAMPGGRFQITRKSE